ncbi:MAG: ATP-binding protein, partial [Porphyromonadaceae bacterium]|nr:ATP-binding protein [Porphyromonadaceae bacterium]
MMNIEWTKLRSYNGDQKNAFEELVCQLARAEDIEGKERFVRVAAPDAGVEAYCILDNGDEFGWQAKFFSSMGNSQWNQLQESFETALLKHPRLTRYYICIPLDRADARSSGRKSLLDRWNEKVTAWAEIAHRQWREIEFEYWGDSEIFDRLSKSEHAGRRYYWFGQDEFSDSWFSQKLEESISNLGVRYTPELNFTMPIS